MYKICAISDTHGQHWGVKIPECDLLIHCGDWATHGHLVDFLDFCEWLESITTAKYIVVIAGNHDFFAKRNASLVKNELQMIPNVVYLENEQWVAPNGMIIWGSPITPTFGDWAFMCDRDKIKRYWDMIPKDTDIIVTHGPSYGILDGVDCHRSRPELGQQHVGCEELRRTVRDINPKYHFFGHIHGAYGKDITVARNNRNGTIHVNCSLLNEQYELVNNPVIVDVL